MYAQYSLTDPNPTQAIICATTNLSIDSDTLLNAGRGEVQIPDGSDILSNCLDITQTPPILVAINN